VSARKARRIYKRAGRTRQVKGACRTARKAKRVQIKVRKVSTALAVTKRSPLLNLVDSTPVRPVDNVIEKLIVVDVFSFKLRWMNKSNSYSLLKIRWSILCRFGHNSRESISYYGTAELDL